MGSRKSVPDGLPAAYQEDNQTCRHKDRTDRQPEGQGVGLAARRVGRTDPTHTTIQKHPGRSEADEATRDRRPARAPRQARELLVRHEPTIMGQNGGRTLEQETARGEKADGPLTRRRGRMDQIRWRAVRRLNLNAFVRV